jgi:hypothetical protein
VNCACVGEIITIINENARNITHKKKVVLTVCINMIFFSQGGTILGEATQVITLGETFIPYQVFLEYVLGLGETTFR